MPDIPWSQGRWTHPPADVTVTDDGLQVTAVEGSDAWRHTAYGFVHDSEHALVTDFPEGSAMEVEFTAAFTGQFDQAGVFVQAGVEHWIKAGVEFADGSAQVGAVVTNPFSDWSLAPVPEWSGRRILVRVSRVGNALTIRAGADGGALRLVRVVPFPPDADAKAGPFVCAPTRAGLVVPIHAWCLTEPDESLH